METLNGEERGQGGLVSVGLMSGEIFKFYSRQRRGFMLVLSIKMQCLLFTAKLPSGGRILAERWSDRISRGERGKERKEQFSAGVWNSRNAASVRLQ